MVNIRYTLPNIRILGSEKRIFFFFGPTTCATASLRLLSAPYLC